MKKSKLPILKFNPIDTLSDQIYFFLRKQIVIGRIPPNTSISENELSIHFDVSRYPIRDALNRLSTNGLIHIIPQRGTFVSKISISNVYEICFIRCAIETSAIRNLAVNDNNKMVKEIIKKLEKNIESQHKLLIKDNVNDKFLSLDDDFHMLLCSFSNTKLAWQILESIKCNLDRVRYLSINNETQITSLVDEHQHIVDAIKNKEYDKACSLIEKHSFEIASTYKNVIENNKEFFDLNYID